MRTLEILLPLLLAVYLAWPSPRPIAIRLLPLLAVATAILHAAVELMRWQMIPLYAIAVVLSLVSAAFIRSKRDIARSASIPLLVVLALSTAVPALLPVPAISATAGAWKVGTRSFELVDPSRREIYSGKDEARRFMLKVWYPAEPRSTDAKSPWMADAKVFAPAIATFMGLPPFFLDHLALVSVPAYRDAPAAMKAGGFPLLLFSHGWKGFDAQNTGQALLLASRGYVVAAVQHSYGAVVTVFPDGSIAENNPSALPEGKPTEEYEVAARRLVDQWSGDLSFALDSMLARSADPSSPFAGLVDGSRVGAWGHSTGGGAVIQFAATDSRCKAVLGMDPFMRPVATAVLDGGLAQPSFFLFSQRWADDTGSRNNALFNRFIPHAAACLGSVSIRGTDHFDFSDLPLLTPLAPLLGLKGPLPGKRVTTIVGDYLLSFFERTLKGEPSPLLSGPSPYAEVRKR